METEIFRVEDTRGIPLGKIYISSNPRQTNSWVGHAISFDLTRSDLQWTYDNYEALKTSLVGFFGEPNDLRIIQEQ